MTDFPHWWDPYSGQPYKLDRISKPRLRWPVLLEYARVVVTAAGLSPAILWRYNRLKPGVKPPMKAFAGLSLGNDPQWAQAQLEMVEELGVQNLLLRIAPWELDKMDAMARYIENLGGRDITINILQSGTVSANQIYGGATCAAFSGPWGTDAHVSRSLTQSIARNGAVVTAVKHCGYLDPAWEVKQDFPDISLLGSSVIDFEPLASIRTLFNFQGYHLDGCASQLYINRRGSAYGKQYGFFNLDRKLRLNKAILSLSNNTANRLWITEINWPLLNTRPYTPNSGNPRSTVDEATQAEYLKQYFELARSSGLVERVYWWQLINPGYGLVDHRGGKLRKMPSYHAFKSLLE